MATQMGRRETHSQAPQMEGPVARWYARVRSTAHQMETYRRQARQLTEGLPHGAAILEVAPGPGFLAVEMARLGRFNVTGLDLSHSFVEMATNNARKAGVRADFHHGDAASLPFPAESFDRVVCQAAFKNFGRPVAALDEMHRVLRPGGTAVIQDMRREASAAEIAAETKTMDLDPLNAFMTRLALSGLRRRAYSRAQFERLATESAFRTCEIRADGIGMEVRLTKRG